MLPSLARPFKKLLPSGGRARKLRFGPAAGATMIIDFDHQLRPYLGLFEAELNQWYRRLVKPGDESFDVGGADGFNSLMQARLSGARVLCFEVDSTTAALARRNFELNPSLHIQLVQLYMGGSNDTGFITIDRAAKEYFPPKFIKMDIEGAEVDALHGAAFVLANLRPKWIIEVHSPEKELTCIEILRDADYEIQIVNQNPLLSDVWRGGFNRWITAQPKPVIVKK